MKTFVAFTFLLTTMLGGFTGSAGTQDIADKSPDNPWYAIPDLSTQSCVDLTPIPWCDGSAIPGIRQFFKDIGVSPETLDSESANTISRYASCWINLRGYSTCSQQMCLVAGVYSEVENTRHGAMLITVYLDRPAKQDMMAVSEYELGPSFWFGLKPLTWEGPGERRENAQPCK